MELARLSVPRSVAGGRIVACDLDGAGRLVHIIRELNGRTVVGAGETTWPALDAGTQGLRDVRWLSDDSALVWPVLGLGGERDAAHGCAAASAQGSRLMPLGSPDRALVSDGYIFGAYGEHRVLGEAVGPYDDDLVTVFDSTTGERLFGAQDLMSDVPAPFFTELSCGCAADGRLTFLADGAPGFWVLDARARTIGHVAAAAPIDVPADALAVCEDEVRLLWLDGSSVRVRRIDARSGAERGAALAFDTGTATDAFAATQARGLSSGRFLLWSDTDVASFSCEIGG